MKAPRLTTRDTRRICWTVLLLVGLPLLSGSCGSRGTSSPTSTSATRPPTTTVSSALIGHELDAFTREAVHTNARLPAAPTTTKVERTFLIAVFDDAQSFWRRELTAAQRPYQRVRVTVFWHQTESRCGPHTWGGPFYCPADSGVYLDLRFFEEFLRNTRLAAAAQAYIIGHEVAHHVQRLLGIASHVDAANHADPGGKNARSVLTELQADCLGGVWAHAAYPRSDLSAGDLDQARRLAERIGDDYAATANGVIADEALFTHGTSQERQHWLRTGFRSGRPSACNTFTSR